MNKKVKEDYLDSFVKDFGDGSVGLSKTQKKNRIDKLVGCRDYSFFKKKRNVNPEFKGVFDKLSDVDFKSLVDDVRDKSRKSKIINVECDDDGSMVLDGIVLDGKENDVNLRTTYSVNFCSDVELASMEEKLLEKGVLRESSDRAMVIHKKNKKLGLFLDDEKVDCSNDKNGKI